MGFAIWYVWGKNGCKPVADYNKHTYLYLKQVAEMKGVDGRDAVLAPTIQDLSSL